MTGRGSVVAVFGPTGAAGPGVVHACLAEPAVSEVRAITRRPVVVADRNLSGAGAKRTSRMMSARVKAEAEDRLTELRLARHVDARPLAILPIQPTGVNRWLLAPLLRVIPPLGIISVDLGRAMLRVGLDKSWHRSRTLENSDLKALLREDSRR